MNKTSAEVVMMYIPKKYMKMIEELNVGEDKTGKGKAYNTYEIITKDGFTGLDGTSRLVFTNFNEMLQQLRSGCIVESQQVAVKTTTHYASKKDLKNALKAKKSELPCYTEGQNFEKWFKGFFEDLVKGGYATEVKGHYEIDY